MYICKFCNQERKNNNSLRNHERLCKLNPEKQHTSFQDLEIQKNKKKLINGQKVIMLFLMIHEKKCQKNQKCNLLNQKKQLKNCQNLLKNEI